MRTLAGPDARVHFTHLSKSSLESLTHAFSASKDNKEAQVYCHAQGVLDLMKQELGGESGLQKICLLDPKAEKELCPEDGDGEFEWFLFGVSTTLITEGNAFTDRCFKGHPWCAYFPPC
jgi:hypothetical protein